ncbi:MAG: hypothetical protein KIT84_10615 [Labilithrix sp.]|nr:hypothetical protein [Labilithrix sp.]MCW5811458.1 hypothetical protein [Labilithrix sp.]
MTPEPDDEAGAADRLSFLEVDDPASLVAVASDPRLTRFLLGRFSDTVALVDPGREDDLVAALRAAGHTPKVVAGARS